MDSADYRQETLDARADAGEAPQGSRKACSQWSTSCQSRHRSRSGPNRRTGSSTCSARRRDSGRCAARRDGRIGTEAVQRLPPAARTRAAKRRAAGTVAVLDGQVKHRQRQQPAGQQIDGAAVLNFTRRTRTLHLVPQRSRARKRWRLDRPRGGAGPRRQGIGQLIWRADRPARHLPEAAERRVHPARPDRDPHPCAGRQEPEGHPPGHRRDSRPALRRRRLDEAKTLYRCGAKELELRGCLLAGYTPRTS